MKRFTCLADMTFVAMLALFSGCALQRSSVKTDETRPAGGIPGPRELSDGGVVITPTDTAVALRSRDDLFNSRPPVVIGWAPDPEYPQKDLRVIERTMSPRVLATATSAAMPGSATFKLGWQSSGSPSNVQIYRQTWTLGATNTREFTQQPALMLADLGPLTNGFQTWTDPSPALNTRNCYYIRGGDGTYWSYSNTACAYSPDPNNPHPVSKVAIRLKLSSASTAVTASNVRVRLNYGVPGSAPIYTWLDATHSPFFTPGAEETFILRSPEIQDLSDITMIRVEVPGTDGLCLQELELKVDDARAFRKTSSTQQCGNGSPFNWAWHSGYIDGEAVEIPFEELRNSSTWSAFNPPFVDVSLPGVTFIGYTSSEFRRKIDSIAAHNLKEDGTDIGSTTRRLRNGNNDVTSITRLNDHEVRVQQHMRLADGGVCTVDAHPTYKLIIRHLDADGHPFTGSSGNIASTEIVSELLDAGIDQNGICQLIPGVNVFIQLKAMGQFGKEFRSAGATDADAPPPGKRFCFPGTGATAILLGFDNGGFSVCHGVD